VRIKEDDKVFLTMERADDHRRELEDELAAERQKRADALADLAEVDVALRNLVNSVEAAKRSMQDKREMALVELARNGCDCLCDCVVNQEDHTDDCEPCLACRIAAILEDQS
jgi:chromosome condensin MukBEF ATPase and DNA-binding subunit MukB